MEKILNNWRSYVNEQTEGLSDLQKQRASEYVASLVKFLIEASEPKLKDVVFELITNWNKWQQRGEYSHGNLAIRSKGKVLINKAESAADKLLQTVINFEKINQLPSLLNGYRKITGSSLTDDLQKIIILPMSVGKKIEQILKIFGTTKKTPAELKSNNLFYPGMQIILKQLAKSFLREGAPLNVRMLGLYLSKFKGPFTEKNLTQSEKEFIKQACLYIINRFWALEVAGRAWRAQRDKLPEADTVKQWKSLSATNRSAIKRWKDEYGNFDDRRGKFLRGLDGVTPILPIPSNYDGSLVYSKPMGLKPDGTYKTSKIIKMKNNFSISSYGYYTRLKKVILGGEGTTKIDKGKIAGAAGEDMADYIGTALGRFAFKIDTKSKEIRIFDNYDFNQADRAMDLQKSGGGKYVSTPSIDLAKHTKHALKNLLKIIKKKEKFNLFNFVEDMSTMVAIVSKNYKGYPVRLTIKYDNNPSEVKPGLWKGFS